MASPSPVSLTSLRHETAELLARRELASMPYRLLHTAGVARAAAKLARRMRRADAVRWGKDWGDQLVAAAWLHDIGYSPNAIASGFHALDGAAYVSKYGFGDLAATIASHTGARREAECRGLGWPQLVSPDCILDDCLTYADLTTAPDGARVTVDERLVGILSRYPVGDPVHEACLLNLPEFDGVVRRIMRLPDVTPVLFRRIVSDVDGTLLDNDSLLEPRTASILSEFVMAGGAITLASGKHPRSFRWVANNLLAPGPHVGCGGSLAFGGSLGQGPVELGKLEEDVAREIVSTVIHQSLRFAVFTPSGIYCRRGTRLPELDRMGEQVEPLDDLPATMARESTLKILTVVTTPESPAIEERLRDRLSTGVHMQRTGPWFLEFGPAGVTKGSALRAVLAAEHSAGACVAFGDAENDQSLFHEADWAVAVGNATAELQDAADEVSRSNIESGVATWVEERGGV